MKSVLTFLKKPLTLNILGLIALSIVVWFGADYIAFGEDNTHLSKLTRVIIILVFVLIWLLNTIRVLWQQSRNNNQMLDGIQQAAKENNNAEPQDERSSQELAALGKRFGDAIAVLRKSKFSGGGDKKSLYQLPWYIIIGPPGTGKTTALVNSGLHFPLADSHGSGALGGVGGTRNCDWWFTDEAVLIDTAGRYTTQDSHRTVDQSAWQGFLKLLKRHRRRQPINGAMIAISIEDLLTQTNEQRAHQAKTIRSRIEELQQQLGVNFPIYLLLTKCDLVAGFSEFFANLSQAEREQVWGKTFALEEAVGDPSTAFNSAYQQLIERLGQRTLERAHYERDAQKRGLILNFPAQMSQLQGALSDFLQQAFSANYYQQQPLLRGVYLTSATQSGSPIDRMMAAVSGNFGFGREPSAQSAGAGKSYFLSRLLTEVIFPEASMATANHKYERLMLWARRGTFALLAAVLFGTLAIWTGSITRNHQYLGEVQASVSSFKDQRLSLASERGDLKKTLPALDSLYGASNVYNSDDHPWLIGLGLYDGRVDDAANELYAQSLQGVFLDRLANFAERQLRDPDQEDALFKNLRIYLMLAQPQRRDIAAITQWASEQWVSSGRLSSAEIVSLQRHLDTLLQSDFRAATINDNSVKRARRTIERYSPAKRVYAQIRSDNRHQDLNLIDEIDADSLTAFKSSARLQQLTIPYIFTREGYYTLDLGPDNTAIDKMSANNWVLGEQGQESLSEADRVDIAQRVEKMYIADYIAYWKKLLGGIEIAQPASLSEELDILDKLSDPSYSPIIQLLQLVQENTQLVPDADLGDDLPSSSNRNVKRLAKVGNLLGGSIKPTKIDREFSLINGILKDGKRSAARIQSALAGLGTLSEYVETIASSPDPDEAAFEQAKKRFDTSSGDSINKLYSIAKSTPEPLRSWLRDSADNSWAIVLQRSVRHLDRSWKLEVQDHFSDNLQGRYPFKNTQSSDVDITDFNSFFGKSGIEQLFFKRYLSSFIDPRTWAVKKLNGQAMAIGPKFIAQLKSASQIRYTFFSESPDHAAINFSLKPVKLDARVKRFELEIGNRENRFSYSHGPQIEKSASWKGGENNRVRVMFEDINQAINQQRFDGDWAWFKLLDGSDMRSLSRSNTQQVVFASGGREATYEIASKVKGSPFNTARLRGYSCRGLL